MFRSIEKFLNANQYFITRALVGLFVLIYFIHWYYVGKYAVNAPLADEWPVMFSPDRIAKPFTWPWVFEFNNEHQTVPTKLQVWLNYILFDVNFAYQIIFNFSLFALTLWGSLKVFVFGGLSWMMALGFLIFALADNDYNNFHWAIQSQWHCFFFGFIWGTYFLFRNPGSPKKDLLIASTFFVFSAWSFASGIVLSFTAIFFFCIHKIYLSFRFKKALPYKKIIATIVIPFVGSLILWSWNYVSPELHPQYVWPWQSRFWSFMSALLSWIFGIEARSDFWSTIALIVTVASFFILIFRYLRNPDHKQGMLLVFALGFLACLASIAMGRGGFGTSMAKVSRYYSIAILLLPVCAYAIRTSNRYGFQLAVIFWLLCLWGHKDNFNFKRTYKNIAIRMVEGLNCTVRDLSQASCSGSIFGGDTSKYWNFAVEKNLSFTRGPFPRPLPE